MKPRVFLLVIAFFLAACGALCLMGGEDEKRQEQLRWVPRVLDSFGHYVHLSNPGPAEKFGQMFLMSELHIRDMRGALLACTFSAAEIDELLAQAKKMPRLQETALAMERRMEEVRNPPFLTLLADDLKGRWIIVVAVLLWIVAAVLVYNFIRARRIDIRTTRGQCPDCGYDLSGAAHAKCPECGASR